MSKIRGYRKNTIVIDFSVLPAKPSVPEVQKFITECMKLEVTQIANLQLSMQKSYVYIELISSIVAEDIATAFNRKFCMTNADGLQKPIPIFLADGTIEVKIFDLPPHMPNAIVANQLTDYGEVLSIREEVWHDFFPGIPNGTRIARMRIKKPIPSYLAIEDMTAYIRYRNQTPTCKHCARNLHIGQKCSEIKKALALADNGNSGLSLADVLQGVNPQDRSKKNEPLPNATLDETIPTPPSPKPNLPPDQAANDDNDAVPTRNEENEEGFEISEEEDYDIDRADCSENPATSEKEDTQDEVPPTPGISNRKPTHSRQEGTKTVSGKRPGSPKEGQKEKRPSRSCSKK